MNIFNRLSVLFVLAVTLSFGQVNTLSQTTLSSVALVSDRIINVASATGIVAPASSVIGTELYVLAPGSSRGEVMLVQAVSGTAISVARGRQGAQTGFPNGSLVLIGKPNYFKDDNPSGSCVTASTFVSPRVNTKTGEQWLCSTITLSWVPGWQNPIPPQVTAAVASVAGLTAVNGPLQHITGTNAITGFTMGTGWNGSGFCVIPDGAFTTTATNNIAKASTAVVNKTLCYAWDATNSLFTPNY